MRSIPPRVPRVPGAGPGQASAAGGPAAGPGSLPGGQPAYPAVDPDTQVLMIEAQRLKMMQEGDDTHKILPPTELTQEVTGGNPGSPVSPGSPF